MQIEGIDRVFIGVRDLDKAVVFFSKMFNAEFVELTGPAVEALEERVSISLEARIELLSPRLPLSENAPSFMKDLARELENRGSFIIGYAYRVRETSQTVAEMEDKGIRIEGTIETTDFDKVLHWRNFKEIIPRKEDTFLVQMSFVQYERD